MNMLNFNLKKALRLFFAVGAFMYVFAACEDDDKKKEIAYDPNKPVELTSFMPDSGRISEMVLLDGSNFGTDPSNIKVFFNTREARVLSSTGTRILALVPRLPGDTCVLSVEVGDKKASYTHLFRYKVAATATTIAGDGTAPTPPVFTSMDQSKLVPVYIGVDKDFNIFVTEQHDYLLKMNEADNSITVLATAAMGFNHRCPPYAHPVTNVLLFGAEGTGNRDRFLTCDPKENWAPKVRFIRSWDQNGYDFPPSGNSESHYHLLYCEADGYYYTRYVSGILVRINPQTWEAKIIAQTPSGTTYGMAFHPIDKTSLWLCYRALETGDVANSICRLDINDPEATFEKLSGPINGGHRDGPLENAQFNDSRMINFDPDGNLYVGDNGNQCIRMINTQTMMVETLIGIPGIRDFKDGSKEDALFSLPHGIVSDSEGTVFVADHGNSRVRRIAIE
jgi:hypothetical protein